MKIAPLLLLILITLSAQKISSQNAPITSAGKIESTGTTVIVPITVVNFTDVASCNLRLTYDQAIGTATLVTKGPGIPGNLDFSVTSPGVVSIGWYHSANVTLLANSVLFNLTFTKVTNGSTALTWFDNGNTCKYSNINSVVLTDVPTSTYYLNGSLTFQNFAPQTIAPSLTAYPGTMISVPIRVNDFNTIGSVSLTLNYDPLVLTYVSPATPNPDFSDLTSDGNVAGKVIIGGFPSGSGLTFPDNTVLITLYFNYLGGSTALTWYDNGTSCEYGGPPPNYSPLLDTPQSSYYLNGSVGPASSVLNTKVFLEGPYAGSGLMSTLLHSVIPISQPYNVAPWNYSGTESVTTVPADVTDWVLVQLRSGTSAATTVYTCAGFLRKDGFIVGLDGTSSLALPTVPAGNYYIVIKHRNHLAIMSNNSVSLSPTSTLYDFSTAQTQAYGTNPMTALTGGGFGITLGNANGDITIDNQDFIQWRLNFSQNNYNIADFNMDGTINNTDFFKWRQNFSKLSFVP